MQTNWDDLSRIYGIANRFDTVCIRGGKMWYPNEEDKANALALRKAADDIKVLLSRDMEE